MNNVKIFITVIVILVLGVAASVLLRTHGTPAAETGKYDAFAQCIKDSGAQFYGAFWCPHCKAQKEMFGASAKYLPYVECSTPDGTGQNQQCTDIGITSYPTWILKDGTRLPTEGYAGVSLETLSQKTGCPLPDGVSPSDVSSADAPASTSSGL